jgi:hypothetical protein
VSRPLAGAALAAHERKVGREILAEGARLAQDKEAMIGYAALTMNLRGPGVVPQTLALLVTAERIMPSSDPDPIRADLVAALADPTEAVLSLREELAEMLRGGR